MRSSLSTIQADTPERLGGPDSPIRVFCLQTVYHGRGKKATGKGKLTVNDERQAAVGPAGSAAENTPAAFIG